MTFDKDVLFSMFQPKVVPITVEHDGATMELYVRELSADQVFRLQDQQKKNGQDNEGFTISLLARALCDENGKSVIDEKEAKRLASMQVGAFNKVAKAVAEAVGLTPDVDKAAAEATGAKVAAANGEDAAAGNG